MGTYASAASAHCELAGMMWIVRASESRYVGFQNGKPPCVVIDRKVVADEGRVPGAGARRDAELAPLRRRRVGADEGPHDDAAGHVVPVVDVGAVGPVAV